MHKEPWPVTLELTGKQIRQIDELSLLIPAPAPDIVSALSQSGFNFALENLYAQKCGTKKPKPIDWGAIE